MDIKTPPCENARFVGCIRVKQVFLFLLCVAEGLVLPPGQLKGQLEFCDVSFAYPTRMEAPIFQNLNLLVPAGTIMAVVGPSGSGKSTLVSLLLRLYDSDTGELFSLVQKHHMLSDTS